MAFAKGGNSLWGHASSLPSEAVAFSYPLSFHGGYCKNTRRLSRVLPKFYLKAHRLNDDLVIYEMGGFPLRHRPAYFSLRFHPIFGEPKKLVDSSVLQ